MVTLVTPSGASVLYAPPLPPSNAAVPLTVYVISPLVPLALTAAAASVSELYVASLPVTFTVPPSANASVGKTNAAAQTI